MSPQLITALIAGGISLVGVFASLMSNRWQLKRKLELDFEAIRQTQLKDVLAKRMEAYPKLWSVMLKFDLNWQLEGKPLNHEWAREFLVSLNECNAEYGVFFSQPVYSEFHKFREAVSAIDQKTSRGESVSEDDLKLLETIAIGENSEPGLGTLLKADLGSYASTVFQLHRTGS